MIQLRILTGKMAGDIQVVRHFPFRIGRTSDNDLVLNEPGVWDHHLTLGFQKDEGFLLKADENAFAVINEEQQISARLRNGDVISFGSAKIQFWLSPPRQRGLQIRELFIWILLAAVTACQMTLISRLLK
jgi:pSer/pThr/pTyr-binding forkhead associated (FHA) protein